MSLVQDFRCKVQLHTWGVVVGDDWGAHQTCTYCGHNRRLGIDGPPEAHDHLRVNR